VTKYTPFKAKTKASQETHKPDIASSAMSYILFMLSEIETVERYCVV
jgi:hypothetical protein